MPFYFGFLFIWSCFYCYATWLNKNISALNGGGAITGIDVQEDGAYITYTLPGGADTVTKKLGNVSSVTHVVSVGSSSSEAGTGSFAFDCHGYKSIVFKAGTAFVNFASIKYALLSEEAYQSIVEHVNFWGLVRSAVTTTITNDLTVSVSDETPWLIIHGLMNATNSNGTLFISFET